MLIYSMKPGHDGAVAVVDSESQELVLAYEAEKDGFPRYQPFNPTLMVEAAGQLPRFPDVFAVSGWTKTGPGENVPVAAGYYDVGPGGRQVRRTSVFGVPATVFSSSHALSHIWCCYGLSPYEQGEPCYVLIWEGAFGDFYEVDRSLQVIPRGHVMKTPGNKYSFLYALADPTFTQPSGSLRIGDAGKLMALCGFGKPGAPTPEERELIDVVLAVDPPIRGEPLGPGASNGKRGPGRLRKEEFRTSPYHDIGLLSPEFTQLARRFSDELFERFAAFARTNLKKGYPLLIAGGCGLNCDWNSAWKETGIFEDVFVPPCANDSGSAIGTAVDAMRELTGQAKLSWDVYRGQEFVDDQPHMADVEVRPLDLGEVARFLADGNVVAWAHGRCEIGPRALGNRSLLAAPFEPAMHERLNRIKQREAFRPIAPICLEEDVHEHFDWRGPSPYMLHFQRVTDSRLLAVTHVDGTARVQTVREDQNALVHGLLRHFRDRTGVGVLCNTSLNYSGSGFINRASDLYRYCRDHGVDAFAYNGRFCKLSSVTHSLPVG